MVKNKHLIFISLGSLLTVFWLPIFSAGFSMEDSWFFRATGPSLKDIWDAFVHLEFGYYRPLRAIFLRLLWPLGGVPSALLYHIFVFVIYLGAIGLFFRLHKGRSLILSFILALALGVHSVFHKPLFWILGMHSILCLFFVLFSMQASIKGKRSRRDVFFLLAILSRELGILAFPALLWGDWFQSSPTSLKQFIKRNSPIFGFFLFFVGLFVSIGSGDPNFGFSLDLKSYGNQLSTYLSIFMRPMESDFVSPPKGFFLWVSFGFFFFMTFVSFSILRKEKSAFVWPLFFWSGILPLAFFGPALPPEYLFLAALGVFGTLIVFFSSLGGRWGAVFAFLFLFQSVHHSLYLMPQTKLKYSPSLQAWELGLKDFLATLPRGKIIVVERIASFEKSPLSDHQVFLDEYLKFQLPQKILWDTEKIPTLAKSATLGTRALKHSILWQVLPRDRFLVVREEESGWRVVSGYLQP